VLFFYSLSALATNVKGCVVYILVVTFHIPYPTENCVLNAINPIYPRHTESWKSTAKVRISCED